MQTLNHFDFSILLNLDSLFTQLLFNYISCFYATNVTVKSFSAAEIAYNIHWYKFPVKNQLFIMQMIRRAQKPFYLKGYNIVECSLTTFLNASPIKTETISILLSDDDCLFGLFSQFIRTAVSYYLVFKQIGN